MPEHILAQFGWQPDEYTLVPLLISSNHAYYLKYQEREYVLRLHNHELACDRAQEARCWQLLAQRGWAPHLYLFEKDFSLSQWLPDVQQCAPDVEQSLLLMGRLSALTLPARQQHINYVDYQLLYQLHTDVAEQAASYVFVHQSWRATVKQWLADYHRSRMAFRFVHQDLIGNILQQDEQLWMIDFEYSGLGHPYWDLAALAQRFSPQQQTQLWQRYLLMEQQETLLHSPVEFKSWQACQRLHLWLVIIWYCKYFPEHPRLQHTVSALQQWL